MREFYEIFKIPKNSFDRFGATALFNRLFERLPRKQRKTLGGYFILPHLAD